MENTPKKNNFLLVSAFLFLMLVGLPMGSWYYLDKGADFRIAQIKDMKPKGDFSFSAISGITEIQKDSLVGKTILASVNDEISTEVEKQVNTLLEQFGGRTDFKVIQFETAQEGSEHFEEKADVKHLWKAHQVNVKDCGLSAEVAKPYWALIDDNGKVRNYYAQNEFEKMVVQTAMILPIEQRKKIDLKRDKEM